MPVLAAFATAQAFFESAGFASPVFLATNNCIGYKYIPGSHWQVGRSPGKSTENDYYASYASVNACANELANWLKRRNVFGAVDNLMAYVHNLWKCGYFGCPEAQYLKGCEEYLAYVAAIKQ